MTTFTARARTVDMLGRQQIAGIPTAISELFKNAHDAYATRVEIDYYDSDELFVLRDDGIGMSKEDFIKYWLTIGTSSKIRREPTGVRPPGRATRPMLGEKGIGRLAIATIGPQVLILTRAWRPTGVSDLTAAFVNWSLFECPGINLRDISIPIREFADGSLPSTGDINEMVAEFKENGNRHRSLIDPDHYDRLIRELECFNIDPREIDGYEPSLSLRDSNCGTHFIIVPASPLLRDDIVGDVTPSRVADKASPLRRALLGFTNTMTPDHQRPVVETALRHHTTPESFEDIIGESDFFTAEEYNNADHQFEGAFDEFGQFEGTIKIYGEEIDQHRIPWRNPEGTPTKCGPFAIAFAAIEPEAGRSTLPPQDHAIINRKTNKIGGLYIYRDGIRILPYGVTDFDWLDIESRRSKSAAYYYFSHRKMFGVVEINAEDNPQLLEKAGREGFQKNIAYRQFRNILQSFLLALAADFFRKESSHIELYEERKKELAEQHRIRKRRQRYVSTRRQDFTEQLNRFFLRVAEEKPQNELVTLGTLVEERLRVAADIENPDEAARQILLIEKMAIAKFRKVNAEYTVPRPRIPLSNTAQREWRRYRSAADNLSLTVFQPARELLDDLVREAASAVPDIDGRRRAEMGIVDLDEQLRRHTEGRRRHLNETAKRIVAEIRMLSRDAVAELKQELAGCIQTFYRTDFAGLGDDEVIALRVGIEERMAEVTQHTTDRLEAIVVQLDALAITDGPSIVDQLVAVEQRNATLEEELQMDLQLVQLGMAVEIINHEFGATVRSLRTNLRRLKTWAAVNRELRGLYESIRSCFDHLDGYLTMFTPLQRRLYRRAIDIRGSDIFAFLSDLFRERLARHGIALTQTSSFAASVIHGFPSSFYPVFVNLVDNAIYWVTCQTPDDRRERRIKLDSTEGNLLVSDAGPGVDDLERDDIFEFGFSRKPGGRGMGLHIARETLRGAGYDLVLGDHSVDEGATFVIAPKSKSGKGIK